MIAEIFAILAFGTFWFWAFLVAAFLILTAFEENDQGVGATLTLIITVTIMQWISHVQVLQAIFGHPWITLAFVALYFLIGSFWGYTKWFLFVKEQVSKFEEFKQAFMSKAGVTSLTGGIAVDFKASVDRHRTGGYGIPPFDFNPQVVNYKAKVLRWMTYWPSSMFWFLVNNPVKKAFNQIFLTVRSSMQRISDRAFASAKRDLENLPNSVPPPPSNIPSTRGY